VEPKNPYGADDSLRLVVYANGVQEANTSAIRQGIASGLKRMARDLNHSQGR
jgi:hypothetical protein